ncbi:ATP-grasp domain-containing protein [Paenibacillus sp. GCM10012307]|uniref:ATP-grasp domain-containing protein n=1 Tax=Paenibacillus roseus TaxID=2798579 RepID=A0A934J7Z1_9BACL|nr:ATP-grasp domain-containing protein [Paenibacillus roseus]MBJ6362391.1 ATP-grasp domain-containing protein [Paenibacillus roseus]
MKQKILMIGFSMVALKQYKDRTDIEVYIIEEEELFEKNKFSEFESKLVKKVVFGNYIDSEDCVAIAKAFHDEIQFDAVFPSKDYAVKATGKIADLLGLPGLKEKNAKVLTNKILLREACERFDIPHPRYKKVVQIEDLFDFYEGKPLIFKPATLQASIGISKIESIRDIEKAWENTTLALDNQKITVSRKINREHIVEEYVDGPEFSVETLVRDNEIIFSNVTEKITFDDNFVEEGHIVPANISAADWELLLKEKSNLVKKLEIGSGLLHSEWKIQDEKPVLIECAGRMPGDYIYDLISYAYEFDFLKEYSMILMRQNTTIQQVAAKVSTVRYFNCPAGELKEIKGIESLMAPEVVDWSIDKSIGDIIPVVKSSWDRVGHFVVVGDSHDEVNRISNEILNHIEFEVEVK